MVAGGAHIGRYTIERELARTELSEVYAATSPTGERVCIKRLSPRRLAVGPFAALGFRREGTLLAELKHPNVVRVLDVGEEENVPYLCFEFVEGRPLDERIAEGPLAVEEALRVLEQLADGLDHVHRAGMAHADLKPANVMLSGEGDALRVKLVDFGLATGVGTRARELSGTPHYMAPEQTGLVDWSIGARTDLYALGVVGWEMLAGKPPFDDADPAALLAKHLSAAPPSLLEHASVPRILERMIAKLLEKNPERRYRSAASLAHDLGQLTRARRQGDADPAFVLDALDEANTQVRAVFVARDDELSRLSAALERARQGRPGAVFLGGVAGVGKSALLNEFKNRTVTSGAMFAAGKCYEFARALPYQALGQALSSYLAQLEHVPEAERATAHERMRAAVGKLGGELNKLAPAFGAIFTNAEESEFLGAGRDRIRFVQMLARLLEALAPVGRPVVLLLDDLQWSDAATLDALQTVIESVREASLLLVSTYRSEEVNDAHPLTRLLTLEGSAGNVLRMDLAPLDRKQTDRMVAESLRQAIAAFSEPVLERLHRRTGGNPLFLVEVIQSLVSTGVFRIENGSFIASDEELDAAVLPSSVIDVVLARLQRLDDETRRLLGVAALVGTRASLLMLQQVSGLDADAIYDAARNGQSERFIRSVDDGLFAFCHDRLQEVCAEIVPETERPAIHSRILDFLEANEGDDSSAFDLAEHAFRAGDPVRAWKYGRRAASLSRARYANQQALELLRGAARHAAVMERDDPEAWLEMRALEGELQTALGQYREAGAIYDELLAKDLPPLRRARLLSDAAVGKQRAGDYQGAKIALFAALELLGVRMRDRFSRAATLWARARAAAARLSAALGRRRALDEQKELVLDILNRLWLIFFVNDTKQVPYVAYRLMSEALPLGPSRELSRAYRHVALALVQKERPAWRSSVQFGSRAVEIARSIGAQLDAGIAMLYTSDVFCWSARYREALPWLSGARSILSAAGNMWELANTHIFSFLAYRGTGELDSALAHAEELLKLGEQLKANGTMANGRQKVAEILLLRGAEAKGEAHLAKSLEIAEANKLNFERFQGYKVRGFSRLEAGRFSEARASFAAAIKLVETPGVSFFHGYVSDAYLGYSEAYLRDPEYFAAAGGLAGEEGERVERYIEERLAKEKRLLAHLGQAWRAVALRRLRQGRPAKSRAAFLRSMSIYEGQERPVELAFTLLLAGESLVASYRDEALSWLRRASGIAERLRLRPLAKRAREALRNQGEAVAEVERVDEGAVTALRTIISTTRMLIESRDHAALLERVVDASLSLLAAERAFLFIEEGGALALRIGKSADGQSIAEEEAGLSRSVLNEVHASGKGIACSDTDQDETLRARASVQAYQVRSVVSVPLVHGDERLGVLYVDSRLTQAIFGARELELLESFAAQAAVALQNARQFGAIEAMNRELDGKVLERTRELESAYLKLSASMDELKNTTLRLAEAKREALEKELEVARRIQLSMVPAPGLHRHGGGCFSGLLEPASFCGGDIWSYVDGGDAGLLLFVGDVTGHGVGSALLAAVAKSCLETAWGKVDLAPLMQQLDRLIRESGKGELLMTAFAARIDKQQRKLGYCVAGHPAQLLVRRDGTVTPMFARSSHLGRAGDEAFCASVADYGPGDRLVLFTDGILEWRNPTGSEYGIRRLQKSAIRHREASPEQMVAEMRRDLEAFAGGVPAEDDLTLVVAELE